MEVCDRPESSLLHWCISPLFAKYVSDVIIFVTATKKVMFLVVFAYVPVVILSVNTIALRGYRVGSC